MGCWGTLKSADKTDYLLSIHDEWAKDLTLYHLGDWSSRAHFYPGKLRLRNVSSPPASHRKEVTLAPNLGEARGTHLFDEVHEAATKTPGLVSVALQGVHGHLGRPLVAHRYDVYSVI